VSGGEIRGGLLAYSLLYISMFGPSGSMLSVYLKVNNFRASVLVSKHLRVMGMIGFKCPCRIGMLYYSFKHIKYNVGGLDFPFFGETRQDV